MRTHQYKGYIIRIRTRREFTTDFDKKVVGQIHEKPGIIGSVFASTGRRVHKEKTVVNDERVEEAQGETMERMKAYIRQNLV